MYLFGKEKRSNNRQFHVRQNECAQDYYRYYDNYRNNPFPDIIPIIIFGRHVWQWNADGDIFSVSLGFYRR